MGAKNLQKLLAKAKEKSATLRSHPHVFEKLFTHTHTHTHTGSVPTRLHQSLDGHWWSREKRQFYRM